MDPKTAAAGFLTEHPHEWVVQFVAEIGDEIRATSLSEALEQSALSDAEAARLFHVSRQAVTKWRTQGVPPNRQPDVWDFVDAINLLARYVRLERLPAVLRRQDANGLAFLDVARTESCTAMKVHMETVFDVRRIAS
ncbi:MAG: hypothetical protein WCP28_20005 [Actinomycetes bacterium]